MTWENYGPWRAHECTWNIDHIVAQSKFLFDSADHEEFKKCWNLSNLRPVSARFNTMKGAL